MADYSPLSLDCIRALTDKMEEKRKFAASEIERMTAEFSMSNNQVMVTRLVIVLGRLCLNHNQNARKGGLIGLAAVMVGFKNGSSGEPPADMIEEVVRPVLTCLQDPDPRVRYHGCQSLCNVAKVAKGNILPQFDSIFDNLSKIVADTDASVRGGAEELDRLLKVIVVEQPSFNIQEFVPRLEDYIYTQNPFTRMFILSWIEFLDKRIDMIAFLPNQLLDGIFNCLYDSAEEIKATTLRLLAEFLSKIKIRPTDGLNLPSMVPTLLKHAKNDREDPVQYEAISWLRQFILLVDDQDLVNLSPGILIAILPCMGYQDASEGSEASSRGLKHVQQFNTPNQGNVCEISSIVNSSLLEQITKVLTDRRKSYDLEPLLEVLTKELERRDRPIIKLAILDWLKALNSAGSGLIMASTVQRKLSQILLETLSDSEDAVVENTLRVVAEIFCVNNQDDQQTPPDENSTTTKDDDDVDKGKRSPMRTHVGPQARLSAKKVAISTGEPQAGNATGVSPSNTNLTRFLKALCKLFREKEVVFEDRGTFIILNLCTMIKADKVYRSFAEILRDEKTDLKFTYNLVRKLNKILFEEQTLSRLRSCLRNCEDDPEMVNLFINLYYAWCYSPIAALTLCLLTGNYRLASEIVTMLAQSEMTVDMLCQIDWVTQLIESPIFVSLRMRLLEVNSNQYLIQSLYGLLMLLPQSEANKRLNYRLDQVQNYMSIQSQLKGTSKKATPPFSQPSVEALIKHYSSVQNQIAKPNHISEKDE